MKNKILTKGNKATKAHIASLWQSPLFQKETDNVDGFIGYVVNKVSDHPICFYEFSEEKLETRHMTPWFNHIGMRKYDNPYMHDLYLFHELYHVATLPDYTITSFESWKFAMWLNELHASLTTEVYIYYWYPELRQHTFPNTIWFDELLEQGITPNKPLVVSEELVTLAVVPDAFQRIRQRRLDIRSGKPPASDCEAWFARYNNYDAWFAKWEPYYIDVQKIRIGMTEDADFDLSKALAHFTEQGIGFYEAVRTLNY
jgi:hypothetical protein